MTETVVRTLGVVAVKPVGRELTHLLHRGEDGRVEDLRPGGAIEAFDERILRGLAGLDVAQGDLAMFTPRRQCERGQLRTVVAADLARRPVERDRLFEHGNDAHRWHCGADFDRQPFAIALVDHVEGAEAPAVVQRVQHEVDRPCGVERRRRDERVRIRRGTRRRVRRGRLRRSAQ